MAMSIWSVDADNIRKLSDFDENVVVKNSAIESFLNLDRDVYNFVMATKGVGKTFMLTMKRFNYQSKNVPCVPETNLRDSFIGDTIFNKQTLALLDNISNWTIVWGTSILLAIFLL
jgi:hypothetical protein